jgi:AcrR family transcriptional regulator
VTERSYHHGNLRAELLARAEEVIDAQGAEALSIRQLARDIGVSHGASARHFRDRQALLDAIALSGFQRLNSALADAVAAPVGFEARFRAAGLAYVQFAVAHPALRDVMYTAKHHPEASAELVESSHRGMAALVELIAAGQASGEVRGYDPPAVALVAFAAVHGVATLATDDLLGDVTWQDAAAATIDFVWEGLAAQVRQR